jgi:hypothetical protein
MGPGLRETWTSRPDHGQDACIIHNRSAQLRAQAIGGDARNNSAGSPGGAMVQAPQDERPWHKRGQGGTGSKEGAWASVTNSKSIKIKHSMLSISCHTTCAPVGGPPQPQSQGSSHAPCGSTVTLLIGYKYTRPTADAFRISLWGCQSKNPEDAFVVLRER